jgi:hypothetical protein
MDVRGHLHSPAALTPGIEPAVDIGKEDGWRWAPESVWTRVLRASSLRVKRPGREADHSPPSSAEVKNAWSYTFTPPTRLHGVVLS